jgi:hypothetical protein
MADLKVIPFPEMPAIQNIPQALRKLAESIEAGEFADAHNLAWVIDCGNSRIECGLMGDSLSPGIEGHFLFVLAQQKIVQGCMK